MLLLLSSIKTESFSQRILVSWLDEFEKIKLLKFDNIPNPRFLFTNREMKEFPGDVSGSKSFNAFIGGGVPTNTILTMMKEGCACIECRGNTGKCKHINITRPAEAVTMTMTSTTEYNIVLKSWSSVDGASQNKNMFPASWTVSRQLRIKNKDVAALKKIVAFALPDSIDVRVGYVEQFGQDSGEVELLQYVAADTLGGKDKHFQLQNAATIIINQDRILFATESSFLAKPVSVAFTRVMFESLSSHMDSAFSAAPDTTNTIDDDIQSSIDEHIQELLPES
jgi:hypothetical protein